MPKKKKQEPKTPIGKAAADPTYVGKSYSRPAGIEGAPKTELTGLSEADRKRVQLESSIAGTAAREANIEKIKQDIGIKEKLGEIENLPQAEAGQQPTEAGQQPTEDLAKQLYAGVLSTNIAPGGIVGGIAGQAERLLTEPGEEAGRIVTGTALGVAAGTLSLGLGLNLLTGIKALGISGVLGKITYANREKVSNEYNDFQNAKSNIGLIIGALNKQQTTYPEALENYNNQIQKATNARNNLKGMTQDVLKNFLGAPRNELADAENFLSPEIQAIYRAALLQGYLNPNTNYDITSIVNQIESFS